MDLEEKKENFLIEPESIMMKKTESVLLARKEGNWVCSGETTSCVHIGHIRKYIQQSEKNLEQVPLEEGNTNRANAKRRKVQCGVVWRERLKSLASLTVRTQRKTGRRPTESGLWAGYRSGSEVDNVGNTLDKSLCGRNCFISMCWQQSVGKTVNHLHQCRWGLTAENGQKTGSWAGGELALGRILLGKRSVVQDLFKAKAVPQLFPYRALFTPFETCRFIASISFS
ncbi:hypothetical protein J6590_000998 [Homalodisca vitripennis]|nr:hypothetical protein J6590_000998 [Homalodisca vitripennis]